MTADLLTPMTALFALLTALYLLVILWDARHYLIPNWLNLAIMAAYPLLLITGWPEPWWGGLAAFAVMLGCGMVLFFLGIMGGGDVKLLAVSMLWTGWTEVSLHFLIYTALAGGVLALLVTIARRLVVPMVIRFSPTRSIARIFRRGEPIPYGLAIAGAFLVLLYRNALPGLAL
ncbi:MAG: pilus assembly protein CpaA [Alphaproteobacteria bacterium]|nr:pilus assembly protein CpaA [Alphaproteobacteria bacterium]